MLDENGARDVNGDPVHSATAGVLRSWLGGRNDISGVVWTAIEGDEFEGADLVSEVLDYLSHLLAEEIHDEARRYIERAPETVRTPVREAVEHAFAWRPVGLPTESVSGDVPLPCD